MALATDEPFLLGILNSAAVAEYFATLSPTIRGGYFRFIYQYIVQIPIPHATQREKNILAGLVSRALAAQESEVFSIEAEIDAYVEQLYGL